MTQPIQAVQICYEHPFGAEREVLKASFLYVLYMELENIDFECTLREYHNKTRCAFVPQELYYRVKLRDNYKCQHCGRQIRDSQKVYIDHVIPISKGGKNIPSNLQVLCEMCNKRKHSP